MDALAYAATILPSPRHHRDFICNICCIDVRQRASGELPTFGSTELLRKLRHSGAHSSDMRVLTHARIYLLVSAWDTFVHGAALAARPRRLDTASHRYSTAPFEGGNESNKSAAPYWKHTPPQRSAYALVYCPFIARRKFESGGVVHAC